MSMRSAARQLGRRGGLARAARLAAGRRKAIAALGGRARSLSHHAERRIAENFRYLEVVKGLGGNATRVVRITKIDAPLPDITTLATRDGGRLQHRRR